MLYGGDFERRILRDLHQYVIVERIAPYYFMRTDDTLESLAQEDFLKPLKKNLRLHLKRIIFCEGEDIRVIRTAALMVLEAVAVPILLGNKVNIIKMAKEDGVCMDFIRVIEPLKSKDFPLFCQRFIRVEKMRGNDHVDAEQIVSQPIHFAALMVLYGYADAVIAGNSKGSAPVLRAMLRYQFDAKGPVFGISVLYRPDFEERYGSSTFFMADTAMTAVPTIEELAHFALETSKFAQHLTGHDIQTSLLSASNFGSIPSPSSQRVQAAVVLAEAKLEEDPLLRGITIEGEISLDAAISPEAYQVRIKPSVMRRSSDVLIFPTLDAADMTLRVLSLTQDTHSYGIILNGILFPSAMISRLASEEQIFGTAMIIGNEAIQHHVLYPEGTARVY